MEGISIINGKSLSELCDYSFGDHIGGSNPDYVIGGFIKPAHPSNAEFLLKCQEFRGKTMSLFIDNIRLYNREVEAKTGSDAEWVSYLLQFNNLLELCRGLPDNKFVIFTSHEDTPTESSLKDKIPENVLAIYATNAIYNGHKIIPFPYGLQRPLGKDNRLEVMKRYVEKDEGKNIQPSKLLYINCGLGDERNATERAFLPAFEREPWATCRFDKNSKFFPFEEYNHFLDEILEHKFMICPQGHGIDCHRNWECLYLRRVPVMKDHSYFRRLMAGFPVLFVDDWPQVTEELLNASEHLFEQAQKMDLFKLDLNKMYKKIMSQYE